MKLRLLFEKEEDTIEAPEGWFTYAGEEFPYWGNPNGNDKTQEYDVGKFNRYVKLGVRADEVISQLEDTVKNERGVTGRCAFAALLMMKYGVRVGNEDSASGYESGLEANKGEIVQTFGTTTLQNSHVSFSNGGMKLSFLGKEQVEHDMTIDDPFLIKYGKLMHDAADPQDKWIGIDYDTMFKFTKKKIGKNFIPKDFRTFCANTTGWRAMKKYLEMPKQDKKSDAKKELADVVEQVADRLGNTPGISRRSYLDNRQFDWFVDQRYEEKE